MNAQAQEQAAVPAGQSSDSDAMLTVADLQAFFKGRDASDMFEKSKPTEAELATFYTSFVAKNYDKFWP